MTTIDWLGRPTRPEMAASPELCYASVLSPELSTEAEEEIVERKLAAILAADVVGFSRLMNEDEAGTLAALKALRVDFIDPTGAIEPDIDAGPFEATRMEVAGA